MDMQEFYEFHGITRTQFAKMIGVNPATLVHFEIGHDIKYESRLRIEIGIEIIEDYKIIFHNNRNRGHWERLDDDNERNSRRFKKAFDRIIMIEL